MNKTQITDPTIPLVDRLKKTPRTASRPDPDRCPYPAGEDYETSILRREWIARRNGRPFVDTDRP